MLLVKIPEEHISKSFIATEIINDVVYYKKLVRACFNYTILIVDHRIENVTGKES